MYTNLKLQIWKSGMRQNRIAQLVGMDETVLSKILNGFRAPNQTVRSALAAVLNTDEDWLFQWDGATGAPDRSELRGNSLPNGAAPSGPGGIR